MYKTIIKADQENFNNSLDFSLIEVKNNKVNARGLWQFLESKQEFANWIKDLIQKYDFIEGQDFDKIIKPQENNKKEYLLKVDTAKEIAMVSNTDNGKKARKYFIECEKRLNKPKTTLELLKSAVFELEKAEAENKKLALENSTLANREIEVKTQKDYKWVKKEVQNDRGRTINYYVNKHFFSGSYAEAHKKAKESFREATGVDLPPIASLMSLEQKKEYLEYLSRL